jgi:dihydroorotase/N-acyl-D-amino-acid deacylase
MSLTAPTRSALALLLLSLASAACADAGREEKVAWDVLLRGGMVIDGTGAPGRIADVAIAGDRIARVGADLDPGRAARVVDVSGHVVAPGFVDLHAHLNTLPMHPGARSHVAQGVTTALGGPDGGGFWPFGERLAEIEEMGVGMNVAYMVGHNSVRRTVMGLEARAPTEEELARMRGMIAQGMDEGAWGISTGLKYLPGAFSEIEEVVALSEAAAEAGGFYTSHLREEGLGLLAGVSEAIEIGRRAGIPIVLTHHKVVGEPMWGASATTLAMVDSARTAGVDVMIDQYPYTASYTGCTILIPAWAQEGGTEDFLARVDDPALRDSILDGIAYNIVTDRGANDLSRVQFAIVGWDESLEGRTMADLAAREGLEPTAENGARLLVDVVRKGGASCIFHAMDQGDVDAIMAHPQTMIASDGRLTAPGIGHPHPRWYGTFPRVLGVYVRERGVLDLETAVHKMTAMPARRMGLADRGEVREGWLADLVVFDPERVIDRATFEDPHRYPEGIPWVFVNGAAQIDGGEYMDVRPGRVLRKSSTR